jgi:hypothetical protein
MSKGKVMDGRNMFFWVVTIMLSFQNAKIGLTA